MQFIYPTLTWAFLLVLVPVLIHLINLMRQQKVKWAAMEFLLQSHKKHRRWIWLKQLILLLLRMLAIGCVVAMLAGLVTKDQWSLLGGQATHHFILLDDTISMTDRTSSGRAFDEATQALRRIAEKLAERPTAQKVTLIRYSQATKSPNAGGMTADLNAVMVDSEFPESMEAQQRSFDVTELALGPGPALEQVERLMKEAPESSRVVYVVSDFRAAEWDQSAELREALRRLRKLDGELHLIRCADAQNQNLAVTELVPEPGTLAAGVPLLVNIKVKNYGPTAAQQIAIRVSARSYPSGVLVSAEDQITEDQVTSLLIDEIPAGEVATRQAQLKFDRAGQHVVEASLSSDAMKVDNTRRTLVDIPINVPVLVIDGGDEPTDAYYLSSVLKPNAVRAITGVEPVSRPAAYLRDVTDTELARFAAVYLLNIERLDAGAISALERYVAAGGGLAVFTGPKSDPRFLIELYKEGKGLFPLPVRASQELIRTGNTSAPDLQVNDHPIFRALVDEGGKNRPLTRSIRIDRYLPADPSWTLDQNPAAKVLASVRDGVEPLVVSQMYGEGQVVAFLTTASPTWNNWALGPSYPVVILQLHGFLSATQQNSDVRITGDPIDLQLDAAKYRAEVEFKTPTLISTNDVPSLFKREPDATATESPLMTFSLGIDRDIVAGTNKGRTGETDRAGVYVAKATTLEGQPVQQRFVVNVPTSDSNLAILESQELVEQFDDLKVTVHNASELDYESTQQDGFSWSMFLAGLLVALLLGEQLFAYWTSYHPPWSRGDG